jgi:hypothetical protein
MLVNVWFNGFIVIYTQQAISIQASIYPGTSAWENADACPFVPKYDLFFLFLFFDKDFEGKKMVGPGVLLYF